MAEILALGISHYPPLAGPDERMAYILRRMLQNPACRRRCAIRPAGPSRMRAEWGNDEGVERGGAASRRRWSRALMKTRAALDAFNPDFVVIWGDDQYENFKEDVDPAVLRQRLRAFKITAPPGNVWGEPGGRPFERPGPPARPPSIWPAG